MTNNRVKALIVTPFDSSSKRINDTISRCLHKLNIEIVKIDHINVGENITNSITMAIDSIDFAVFDITRQNPSVMYELGYAQALRKPIIIIVNKETTKRLPFDIQGFYILVYDTNNLRNFSTQFTSSAKRFINIFNGGL